MQYANVCPFLLDVFLTHHSGNMAFFFIPAHFIHFNLGYVLVWAGGSVIFFVCFLFVCLLLFQEGIA